MVAAGACLLVAAAPAWSAQPTDQDITNRLLGTSPKAAGQTGPDCSTQQALENNPACGQTVQGGQRGFKLFDQGKSGQGKPGQGKQTGATPPPTGGARGPKHAGGTHPSSAAAGCGLADASDSRAVNLCVTFALNSTVLTVQSKQSLDQLIKALNSPQIAGRGVQIEGFADASGKADANLKLSDARARAVADYLGAHGIAAGRVEAKGFGATRPLAGRPPTDPANRRVEARLKD